MGAFKKPAAAPEGAHEPEPPPPAAGAVRDHQTETPDAPTAPLVLDDVILAWERVLEHLPRSLRTAIQEAQPFERTDAEAADELAAHTVTRIRALLPNRHRHVALAQADAQCQSGQAAADDGDRFTRHVVGRRSND